VQRPWNFYSKPTKVDGYLKKLEPEIQKATGKDVVVLVVVDTGSDCIGNVI